MGLALLDNNLGSEEHERAANGAPRLGRLKGCTNLKIQIVSRSLVNLWTIDHQNSQRLSSYEVQGGKYSGQERRG